VYHHLYHECGTNTLKALYILKHEATARVCCPCMGSTLKDIVALESVQGFATKLCTKACQGVDYSEQLCMLDLPILIRQGVTSNFVTSIKSLMDWHFYPVNCLVTFINLQCPTRTYSRNLQIPFAHFAHALHGILQFIIL